MKPYTTKVTVFNPHTGLYDIVETTRYTEQPTRSKDIDMFFTYENDEMIKRLYSKVNAEGNAYWHIETTSKILVSVKSPTIQLNELLHDLVADIEENIELPKEYSIKYHPVDNDTHNDIDPIILDWDDDDE